VWSRHRTTIHDAVAAGLSVDIEQLRRGCADADTWRQEFECEFIDSARVAFPYDLISRNESDAATMTWPPGWQVGGPLHVGIDVGSLHDPTVCLTLEEESGRHIVREVLIIENMELADQVALLVPRVHRAARASIDASGIGLDISQRLRRMFGGRVIAQTITAKWKRQAFQALQAALADGGRIALPADRRFRDDLHAYEVHGAGETASFRAPRTDEGHSDITSALVHAWDAATASGTGSFSSQDAATALAAMHAHRPAFSPARHIRPSRRF
jgi:phage FluMu gp28-like protein